MAGYVDETAAGTDERKEGTCSGEGTVVITLESLLDDIDVCDEIIRMSILVGGKGLSLLNPSMATPALFTTMSMPSGCS